MLCNSIFHQLRTSTGWEFWRKYFSVYNFHFAPSIASFFQLWVTRWSFDAPRSSQNVVLAFAGQWGVPTTDGHIEAVRDPVSGKLAGRHPPPRLRQPQAEEAVPAPGPGRVPAAHVVVRARLARQDAGARPFPAHLRRGGAQVRLAHQRRHRQVSFGWTDLFCQFLRLRPSLAASVLTYRCPVPQPR